MSDKEPRLPTVAGYSYTCNECSKIFTTMENLVEHYEQNHPQMAKRYLEEKGGSTS